MMYSNVSISLHRTSMLLSTYKFLTHLLLIFEENINMNTTINDKRNNCLHMHCIRTIQGNLYSMITYKMKTLL